MSAEAMRRRGLRCLPLVVIAGAACAEPRGAPARVGTYIATPWPEGDARPARAHRGLVASVGEVAVLEGDAELVSGSAGAFGLRLDEERNDLSAIAGRFATEFDDVPATLVLFTSFQDRGGGGPAYFVPFFDATPGTGREPLDQRAAFGVGRMEGFVNMKRLSSHEESKQLSLLIHEFAHRHLAYMRISPTDGSTVALPLLGRQQAHWHAALHTSGSVLGGHGFVEPTPGRFVVARRDDALSALDLYGLGLLEAAEVEPFFFIDDLRTQDGIPIPAEAQLDVGAEVTGRRVDIDIAQIVSTLGPRAREDRPMPLVFALLTAPGETATATAVTAEARRIDALRLELESAWPRWTRGRGTLCTQLAGCRQPSTADAAATDADEREPPRGGCVCAALGPPGAQSIWLALLLFGARRRNEKRP